MQNHGISHEQFVHEIAAIGIGRLADPEARAKAGACKLTYGAGQAGLRGITYFQRWLNDKGAQQAFVEICAHGEENPVQLAGTTLHELGHVLAGCKPNGAAIKPKPCSAGTGARGGKSRGVGSGSRLRKYVCEECGQILRASTDELEATHNPDGGKFVLS